MNHIGNNIESAHFPASGYASIIIPLMTLRIPVMSDSIGPKPINLETRAYINMSSMPVKIAKIPYMTTTPVNNPSGLANVETPSAMSKTPIINSNKPKPEGRLMPVPSFPQESP